ncbi:hypothetical protein DH2020_030480 [Rehmannia glutinosa]|uniref:Uncharacterized protein n=1 Tax=Rehmannia glutinosa TaxID=99300 RepID=A0ABR0VKP3_REHGL
MASIQLTALIIPFLFLSLSTAEELLPLLPLPLPQPSKQVEKFKDVVVEGLVLCQSCEQYGTDDVDGAKPIEAATVRVICKFRRNGFVYDKTFETDKNGYFYGELKDLKISSLEQPLRSCKVKLVSSPLSTCNLLTNVHNGLNGAPLRYEDKKITGTNYEAVVYAAGPLAFAPANCAPKAEQP